MVEAIAAGGLGPDDSLPNAFSARLWLLSVEIIRASLAAEADPNHRFLPLWWAVKCTGPRTSPH